MVRQVYQERQERVARRDNQEREVRRVNQEGQEQVVFQASQVIRDRCNQGNHLCQGSQCQHNQEVNQVGQVRVAPQGKEDSPVAHQEMKVAASNDHRVHRRAFSDILKAVIDFIVA